MATDATALPTTPNSIPRFNTPVDSPSGDGFNAAMDQIQAALDTKLEDPGGKVANEILAWGGAAWASVAASLSSHFDAVHPRAFPPGTNGQWQWTASGAPAWTSLKPIPNNPVQNRDSATTISGTTSETTLYTFSVPGNTLGLNQALRLTIIGEADDAVAGAIYTLRVKYGGTTHVGDLKSGQGDTNPRQFVIEIWLCAAGATNKQFIACRTHDGTDDSEFNVDKGHFLMCSNGLITVDSTSAQTLAVTLQPSNAAYTYVLKTAILELL